MRIIDADALPNELFKKHVHDGEELVPMLYYDDAVKVVEDAPTIPAIPVEWLAQKARIEDGWGNIPFSEYLKLLIWEWHQQEDDEQEAR